MTAYRVPAAVPRSSLAVRIDGAPAEVYATQTADFLLLSGDGPFVLEIDLPSAPHSAAVRPARLDLTPELDGATIRIPFPRPLNASIECEGFKPLFLFASPPETFRPDPDAPGVRYYGGGRVYDEGTLRLASGETLYVEGGTVLRATIIAENATGIRICGHGVIDGSLVPPSRAHPLVTFSRCRGCRVENVTLVRPSNWMLVLGGCDGVRVDNLHEIGEVVCSDGIDIVGSRDIDVGGSFLVNNDDCIAVKSMPVPYLKLPGTDWGGDVRAVRIHGCSFLNLGSGNAMEIGFELRADLVEDIVFEDIDVLAAHQYAAVFSIHDGDRALVRRIRYRDIRVEHYWDKLVDIRILLSRYSRDPERGRVEDIAFERIRCIPNRFNPPSLIGGFDAAHRVSGVAFRDFRIGDRPVLSADDLQLYTKQADGISFSP